MNKKILITSALPYANGSIHIGHLVEYIQTDVWVRYLRMLGEDIIYICADDTHGTPIEIRAYKEGTTPEKLVERYHQEHFADFTDFKIKFDLYGSTHCDENKKWSEYIYNALKSGGHIETREIELMYCNEDKRFLPDRFIRGTCPKCGSPDQYGDQCEICSATYEPVDLKDAKCSICGKPPVQKKSQHDFVKLNNFKDKLIQWLETPGRVNSWVKNYVMNWIKDGLKDWDITRDGPYFGFNIPGYDDKYFYVWLDAPIGYISNTERWCKEHNRDVEKDYWKNPDTNIYHFIGKDITYFHNLFWPAMLMASNLTLPSSVFVHGFLTVEGQKMSKSKGTFITARSFLNYLDPQYLRYYYASKLSGGVDDIDLSFTDFVNRVNAELVNKIANLASRSISFLGKKFKGQLSKPDENGEKLIAICQESGPAISDFYKKLDFASAIRTICQIAEKANLYFQENAPWDKDEETARKICTTAINVSRILAIYLQPILPDYAEKMRIMLKEDKKSYDWQDINKVIFEGEIGEFIKLIDRMDDKRVDSMVEANKSSEPEQKKEETKKRIPVPELAPLVEYDEFMKGDLRVALIVDAKAIPEADKIVKFTLDLGELGKREVFAGIKKSFPEPEKLIGKKVAMVANLQPRKMRFGVSEGMVLAVGEDETKLSLLELPENIIPGSRIR